MDGLAALTVGGSTRLKRTTNPAATDKIALLRAHRDADDFAQAIDLIADILTDLNEVPLYR